MPLWLLTEQLISDPLNIESHQANVALYTDHDIRACIPILTNLMLRAHDKPITHEDPLCKWIGGQRDNYSFAYNALMALYIEYQFRYGEIHSSQPRCVNDLFKGPNDHWGGRPFKPYLRMAGQFTDRHHPVSSNRRFYHNAWKTVGAQYNRGRPMPSWMVTM